jgi:multiple sugar transport system ATP-binding protein
MANVSLRRVVKAFGPATIINDLSLTVRDGEFMTLVGPSGSGKSTLLRLVAGLERPSAGEILIGDRVVNDVPSRDRDVAMVFQNYALYPQMTVAQNLGFALRMRKVSKGEVERRVAEAARALDLTLLLDRYPRQLSGGQRQRVATGRAIVRKPQLFLFDEPLSNLDAKLRVQVRAELRDLHRQIGVTSLYVTHDQVEAMTMGDRIAVLRGGVVEQVGAPLELYDRPANLFVATFIGSPAMNLLAGRRSGDMLLMIGGQSVPLRPNCGIPDGEVLTLGIRPEHVAFGDKTDLAVSSVTLEQTGAETTIIGKLAGEPLVAVVRERLSVAQGSFLPVRLPRRHHHYFDRSGRRVATP